MLGQSIQSGERVCGPESACKQECLFTENQEEEFRETNSLLDPQLSLVARKEDSIVYFEFGYVTMPLTSKTRGLLY